VSSTFLEIVQLDDGEFALLRSDDSQEPLVNIRFSEASQAYLNDASLDVAKVMIQAGIEAVAQMNEQQKMKLEEGDSDVHTLH
jgi:hypothetical protein